MFKNCSRCWHPFVLVCADKSTAAASSGKSSQPAKARTNELECESEVVSMLMAKKHAFQKNDGDLSTTLLI